MRKMRASKTTKGDRFLRSNSSSKELPTNQPRRLISSPYSKLHPTHSFPQCTCATRCKSLFDSGRVANARVEVIEEGANRTGPVRLRFVVQRQVQIGDVRIELGPVTGSPISTDELRSRLNFVQSGNRLTKQLIARNADEIQVYLRDRGYFNATVEPVEQLGPRGLRANVTYKVTPGPQAKVEAFEIKIAGFDPASVRNSLTLQPGVPFTRDAAGCRRRQGSRSACQFRLSAPVLEDARVERDAEKNTVKILLEGAVGPKVDCSRKELRNQ